MVEELIEAFRKLDAILEIAAKQVASSDDCGAADPYRGLQIPLAELDRIFSRQPCSKSFEVASTTLTSGLGRLAWLGRAFELNSFDLKVIFLSLAPEVDLRYERLYAYLQDDVTRRRPTVDLALNLFAGSLRDKFEQRSRFAADSPLIRHRLVHLLADPAHIQPPLLSHYLKLEGQLVGFILGETSLDHRLYDFCRLESPASAESLEQESDTPHELPFLAARMRQSGHALTLYFQGPGTSSKLRAAKTIASRLETRLLLVDLSQAPENQADFQESMQRVFREAFLQGVVLYLDNLDGLAREGRQPALRFLADRLEKFSGVAILSGSKPWMPVTGGPAGVRTVRFGVLDRSQALTCWQSQLARAGLDYIPEDLLLLSDRFRLTADQIADAVACARNEVIWQSASKQEPTEEATLDQLCAAARAECGSELGGLARKIRSKYTWEDIVLPPDQLDQLKEVCLQAEHWHTVFGQWGLDRKLSLGKGLNVLFSGPPGTGKTMASEVLANALQLDLYKIDLSQIVSKYIGETEKNLDRIFVLAEHSNAILFFDEADALFGKRSEVKDSHDRYANIEVGYLLQKMEEYEGIAILATNVKHHIDEAFVRRMQVIIEFPFPEEAERKRVWQVIFPEEAPLGEDVDFGALARTVRLAGGNIRNIARASAFYAAGDGGTIQMRHLVKASRREYQKLGRDWHELAEAAG